MYNECIPRTTAFEHWLTSQFSIQYQGMHGIGICNASNVNDFKCRLAVNTVVSKIHGNVDIKFALNIRYTYTYTYTYIDNVS